MKLSNRLDNIARFIPNCKCIADIGTDHGLIPIYAVLNGICDKAIASDIKKGPLQAAKKNIEYYGLLDKIELRLGSGLEVLKLGEANVIVIAGMGGYTISNLLEAEEKIAKEAEFLILQPTQHPEALRRYLVNFGFKILDEELVKDDNKYYHIIKTSKGEEPPYKNEAIYYLGLRLIEKKHYLLREYLTFNLKKLYNVSEKLDPNTQMDRYKEVHELIKGFEDVMKCL
ncbi:SAM-dependent methyltransferase [Caloramator sp. E03]|uniref:tRNA (adenine(22)-N(1))-methyltransferase n=1 Tax=Caloramator sp. E03 TaxID=2576307 RepID=UPI0011109D5D|nr:class I SAM-dependent methyltransferase [Caloramator sp. E03]QCX32391.1 SAM-dependent methyltransferase [Caloramator sp. E03]